VIWLPDGTVVSETTGWSALPINSITTATTLNYRPVEESEEDMRIMRIMDEIYLEDPCVGSRRQGRTP